MLDEDVEVLPAPARRRRGGARRLDGGRFPQLIGGVGKVGGEPEEEEARARRRAAVDRRARRG